MTTQDLSNTFSKFVEEARRLQAKYHDQISLLVGIEIDWIRPESKAWIESLLSHYQLDTMIGSVHHVHGIPIDLSPSAYGAALSRSAERAQELNAAGVEMLFADYFDTQLEMLQALKPPIVGHFDLIRLMNPLPNASLKTFSRVWRKVLRNLLFVSEYGGVLEINASGLRKGLVEPYPNSEICSVCYLVSSSSNLRRLNVY